MIMIIKLIMKIFKFQLDDSGLQMLPSVKIGEKLICRSPRRLLDDDVSGKCLIKSKKPSLFTE